MWVKQKEKLPLKRRNLKFHLLGKSNQVFPSLNQKMVTQRDVFEKTKTRDIFCSPEHKWDIDNAYVFFFSYPQRPTWEVNFLLDILENQDLALPYFASGFNLIKFSVQRD